MFDVMKKFDAVKYYLSYKKGEKPTKNIVIVINFGKVII